MRHRIAALLVAGSVALAGVAGCSEEDAEREAQQGKEAAGEAADDAERRAREAKEDAEK